MVSDVILEDKKVSPKDIMRDWSKANPVSGRGFSDMMKGLSPTFDEKALRTSNPDIMETQQAQAQSSYENVFIDPEPDRTVMDDIDAGNNVDRTPPKVVTQDLMLDPNKPAPEAEKTHDKAVNAQEDVQEKMGKFEQDWDAHQSRAAEYLKEAAENLGMDSGNVLGQMLPPESKTKMSAVGAIASGAVTAGVGAGSMAVLNMAGQVSYGAEEMAKDRKDLTREQKKALIEEVCKIAQSHAPKDTRASASVSKSGGYSAKDVDANLAKLSPAKMEKLLTQTVDQQPEYRALKQMNFELDQVMDNHVDFANHYHEANLYDKMLVLADGGNEKANDIITSSQTVAAASVTGYAANDGPDFDAGHAGLAADSLAGFVDIRSLAVKLDSTNLCTNIDTTLFARRMPEAANEAYAYAQKAIFG